MEKDPPLSSIFIENTTKFIFSIYQLIVRIFIKIFITYKPKQRLPPITNKILLQSASDLAYKIRNKQLTSTEVVKAYINRIIEINPILNFVVDERFEDAIYEASNVDEFLETSNKSQEEIASQKPLLGVPCTIKESLAVKGLKHTAGMVTRKDIVAEEDAEVVRCLKEAGAIVLAVTNTPEACCCWWESYNSLYGRTYNPYNTNCTPGGSSGGEGAAIGGGGSLFGIGSDFGGSIRIPACFNGVFGHRPTSLTTSLRGHKPVPLNTDLQTLLVMGPLARYSRDLRPILKLITKPIHNLKLDDPVNLKNVKVYYLKQEPESFLATPVDPAIWKAIQKVVAHFKSIGATVEGISLPKMKYATTYWFGTLKTEDDPQVAQALANYEGKINIYKEILKSIFGLSKHAFPALIFGLLESANGVQYKGTLHSSILNKCKDLHEQYKEILGTNGIFILPTHPTTAPRHYESLGSFFDASYTGLFNVFGFPATHCPIGLDNKNMPIGVQVVANSYQDRLTLAAADEIEKAFGGWVPPV